jgi:hypothetical protein
MPPERRRRRGRSLLCCCFSVVIALSVATTAVADGFAESEPESDDEDSRGTRFGFGDMLEVENTPLLQYLSSTVDSVRIRGMPLKDYFSKEHMGETYRGATLLDFPLHRIIDLILFQVTGLPEINLQESFEYIRDFAIGAIQVRMDPSSGEKKNILSILESFSVTFDSELPRGMSLDNLDVPLLLDLVEKRFLQKGEGKKSPCRCKLTLLEIGITEGQDYCMESHRVCFTYGKEEEDRVGLAVAPTFHRTWNTIQNQRNLLLKQPSHDAVANAVADHSSTKKEGDFSFFSRDFVLKVLRSSLSDILLAVGSSSGDEDTAASDSSLGGRGLFDLDVGRDVCINYREQQLCAQSVL